MANVIKIKSGDTGDAPASDALVRGELAIRHVAGNHTASSSSKLYFGEGQGSGSVTLRQFGFGITDGSTQSGVAIGENLTFSASGNATVSVSGQTVTIGATASSVSGNTFATDLKIGRDAHNLIDFTTDDQITFNVANAAQLVLTNNLLAPSADDDLDLGSSSQAFQDLYLEGNLNFTDDSNIANISNITGHSGSHIVLDSANDIILDADGGDISLKDGGTQFAALKNNSTNLLIESGGTTAATFSGADLTLAGALTVTGNLVPSADDTHDLGTTSAAWQDLHIEGNIESTDAMSINSSAGDISFGPAENLTLGSNKRFEFRDDAIYIHSSADGQLDLVADTEIQIAATTIDMNGNAEISGTLTVTGDVDINGGAIDGTAIGANSPSTGTFSGLSTTDISIGLGDPSSTNDTVLTFNSSGNDGVLTWDQSADKFEFSDKVQLAGSSIFSLRDGATYIHSPADNDLLVLAVADLELQAGTFVKLDTPVVDFEDDGVILKFGDDSDVTLTHVADTGLLLNSTRQLQFNNSSESIHSDGGHLIFTSNNVTFDFPSADGSSGQVLQTNGSGVLSFASASSGGTVDTTGTVNANEFAQFNDSNTLQALTATEMRSALNVDDGADDYGQWNARAASTTVGVASGSTFEWAAGEGLDVSYSSAVITYSAEDATTSNKGVASFSSDDFSVSSGAVSLASAVDDVSVTNLKTRLAGGFGSNAVTIGDSGDVVTIGGSLDLGDGNITNVGDIKLDSITGDGDTNTSITFSGSDVITFNTSGNDIATFQADGDLQLSHDIEMSHDAAHIKFGSDLEISLSHVADTGLTLADSGGSPTLQLHDANEAISSDGSKLILTSNGVAFSMPTADGSDGQQLTTDGSGTLSWAAAGSGGGGGSGTVSSGTANSFAHYASTGTTVSDTITSTASMTASLTGSLPELMLYREDTSVSGSNGIARFEMGNTSHSSNRTAPNFMIQCQSGGVTQAANQGGSATIFKSVASGSTLGNHMKLDTDGTIKDINGAILMNEAGPFSSGGTILIQAQGNGTCDFNLAGSDERIKHEIDTFEYGLKEIEMLNPKYFKYSKEGYQNLGITGISDDGNKNHFGVKRSGLMAQDIEKAMPEGVVYEHDDGIKSYHREGVIAALINSVKELSARVKELEGEK